MKTLLILAIISNILMIIGVIGGWYPDQWYIVGMLVIITIHQIVRLFDDYN